MNYTNNIKTVGFLCLVSLIFSACQDKTIETKIYNANVPIYMPYEDFRTPIEATAAKELTGLGRLYFKDNYLFINKQNEGVHVINDVDPTAPNNSGFINIIGNTNCSIKGNIMYANSLTDLVAIDISDPANPVEIGRAEGVFPYGYPTTNNKLPLHKVDESKGVIIGWKVEQVTDTYESDGYNSCYNCYTTMEGTVNTFQSNSNTLDIVNAPISFSPNSDGPNNSGTGTAGSMAGMSIVGNHLYTIENNQIYTFDISIAANPILSSTVSTWRTVETMFPYGDKLFLGTTTGMMIYDIVSPAAPVYFSEFDHAEGCDPVIVAGDYAYVTLRSGNNCGAPDDELHVVDISDLANPVLLKSYEMSNPYGLGIDGTTLFLCDGHAGLKVYDITDNLNIDQHQIGHYGDINTYDVIPLGNVLMMIGDDGLYQYDYSIPENLKLMSVISLGTE